jgi:hypothetical protein
MMSQVLAYALCGDMLSLISRATGTSASPDVVTKARSATPAYIDSLSEQGAQRGFATRDAKVCQILDVWRGVLDFDIRVASYDPVSLLVFVRTHEDWLKLVDVCCDNILVDKVSGIGTTAGCFEK